MKQCGLTDAAVVETLVIAADGDTTIADVVYFDSLSGERAILEISVVTVGSGTSLAQILRAGMDSVTALLLLLHRCHNTKLQKYALNKSPLQKHRSTTL